MSQGIRAKGSSFAGVCIHASALEHVTIAAARNSLIPSPPVGHGTVKGTINAFSTVTTYGVAREKCRKAGHLSAKATVATM